MHGTPTEIFSDVGSSPMRMSIQDVEKLKTKPVQRLVLLQCSVGKIEKAGNNIASAFARSVTGKVLAGDGVVNQNEVKLNKKENNIGDDFCKEGQNIFVRYYVDDEGWYIYKHDWNERVVKYTYAAPNGKMYRLYQLINMLDTGRRSGCSRPVSPPHRKRVCGRPRCRGRSPISLRPPSAHRPRRFSARTR